MRVIVQVKPETARQLVSSDATSAETTGLLQRVRELNVELTPLCEGTEDPELSGMFCVNVSDGEDAEPIRQSILECEAVAAAYTEPTGGPPV